MLKKSLKWPIINKNRVQPNRGTYSKWKQPISVDCNSQCIYCAIRDQFFGGIRNFHVEHFKPKKHFPSLENNINNLYYSCPVCNLYKGAEWFFEGELQYICPTEDYNNYFKISGDLIVEGECNSSKYMVEKLHLNRVQLLIYRKETYLTERSKMIIKEVNELMKRKEIEPDTCQKIVGVLGSIVQKLASISESPLYDFDDLSE